MATVEYQRIGKSFGAVTIMRDISFRIEDHEFVVLLGPSGCGKTTLLRMTAGLESVSEGDLMIGGKRVNDVHPRDRSIAMVFQNYALYPTMKVYDNIAFSLEVAKIPAADIKKRVEWAAATLNLTAYLDRYPKELSGGQRQRVAMGRAMVREAEVFLFDEPLSNLDAKLRAHMRTEIRQLHNRLKTTTIYVTHDQIEAMTLADRIVAMHGGVVQQVGTPLDLYDRPANLFVAGFIGSPGMNFFEGRYLVSGDHADLKLENDVTLPARRVGGIESGEPATLGIRPEHVVITEGGALEGRVDLIEPTGFGIIMHVTVHDVPLKVFTLNRAMLNPGATVRLNLPRDKLHLFDGEGRRLG